MSAPTATRWVYDFTEGSREMRDLLGGKGANIAEMTRVLGPELVPAGFTITTEACVAYMHGADGGPEGLDDAIDEALARLEEQAGKRLADPEDPLLVSVRSGARDSMPGMMDTVLNLGLNDESVAGFAARTGNDRLAWDSYRRLVQMFGDVVCGVPGERFEEEIAAIKREHDVKLDTDLDADALRELTGPLPRPLRLPERPARAAAARDPRRLRLLDGRAGGRLPAHQGHSGRLGHRGQRPADGVRQHGRRPPARASRSRATRSPARPSPAATSSRTRRARTSCRACARRATSPSSRLDARGRRPAARDPAQRWSTTTRTCRTPSSPSRRDVCTCCRRAAPSAPPRRRCASPSTPSMRA